MIIGECHEPESEWRTGNDKTRLRNDSYIFLPGSVLNETGSLIANIFNFMPYNVSLSPGHLISIHLLHHPSSDWVSLELTRPGQNFQKNCDIFAGVPFLNDNLPLQCLGPKFYWRLMEERVKLIFPSITWHLYYYINLQFSSAWEIRECKSTWKSGHWIHNSTCVQYELHAGIKIGNYNVLRSFSSSDFPTW